MALRALGIGPLLTAWPQLTPPPHYTPTRFCLQLFVPAAWHTVLAAPVLPLQANASFSQHAMLLCFQEDFHDAPLTARLDLVPLSTLP